MIYITQLIYINQHQEETFDEFEKVAIPIISRYNGKMMLRIRPDKNSILESSIEQPYEVHVVSFDTENDFEQFMRDEERKNYLHLKEQSVKSVFLFKGKKI
ncbi:MAG: DUF1330 domain-containing protein [Bacteroidota bacterium]